MSARARIELRLCDHGQISEQAAELDELCRGTLWIPGLGGGGRLIDALVAWDRRKASPNASGRVARTGIPGRG